MNKQDRDCAHCIHLKEDGCEKWECEYVNINEALRAYEEKKNEQILL